MVACLLQDSGYALQEFRVKIKKNRRLVLILAPMAQQAAFDWKEEEEAGAANRRFVWKVWNLSSINLDFKNMSKDKRRENQSGGLCWFVLEGSCSLIGEEQALECQISLRTKELTKNRWLFMRKCRSKTCEKKKVSWLAKSKALWALSSTILSFLVPRNVTSDKSIALLPTLAPWWQWWRTRVTQQMEEMQQSEVRENSMGTALGNGKPVDTTWKRWTVEQSMSEKCNLHVVRACWMHFSFLQKILRLLCVCTSKHQRKMFLSNGCVTILWTLSRPCFQDPRSFFSCCVSLWWTRCKRSSQCTHNWIWTCTWMALWSPFWWRSDESLEVVPGGMNELEEVIIKRKSISCLWQNEAKKGSTTSLRRTWYWEKECRACATPKESVLTDNVEFCRHWESN